MTAPAVTVAEAAQALNVTPAAVRLMLRQGAPSVSPGAPGRGRGALVVVADLKAWRVHRAGIDDGTERFLGCLASGLLDVVQRDAGEGAPLHRSIGITEQQTAAVLVTAFERVYRRLHGRDAQQVPPEIERLLTVCVQSSRDRSR